MRDTVQADGRNSQPTAKRAVGGVPMGWGSSSSATTRSFEKYFDRLNGPAESGITRKLQEMPPEEALDGVDAAGGSTESPGYPVSERRQVDIGEPFLRQYLKLQVGQIISKSENSSTAGLRDARTTAEASPRSSMPSPRRFSVPSRQSLCPEPQQIADIHGHHAPSIVATMSADYKIGAGTPFRRLRFAWRAAKHRRYRRLLHVGGNPAHNQKRFYRRSDRQR